MIELSPTTAIMLYLCITLATLLAIWGYHHYYSRMKKVDISQEKLIICEYCHYTYLDQIAKPITKCPQCESFSKT